MLLYAFTDTHGDMKLYKEIQKRLAKHKPDLIIMAGDFTWFEDDLHKVAKILNELPAPVLLLPGNHEGEQTVIDLNKHYKNIYPIHMARYDYKNFKIFGYGSGGFATTDPRFNMLAKHFKRDINKEDKVILAFHQPPYGTKCDTMEHGYVGSKSFREFIAKVQPILVICGHIHDCFDTQDKIGESIIVNPGPIGMYFEL